MSGIDTALLDTWAAQQQGKNSPLEGIGAFGAALLGGQDSLDGPDRESPASLVSAKEERDLQTLLEMFAMGVGDVEQFQVRLQDELAALEVSHTTVICNGALLTLSVFKQISGGPQHDSQEQVCYMSVQVMFACQCVT